MYSFGCYSALPWLGAKSPKIYNFALFSVIVHYVQTKSTAFFSFLFCENRRVNSIGWVFVQLSMSKRSVHLLCILYYIMLLFFFFLSARYGWQLNEVVSYRTRMSCYSLLSVVSSFFSLHFSSKQTLYGKYNFICMCPCMRASTLHIMTHRLPQRHSLLLFFVYLFFLVRCIAMAIVSDQICFFFFFVFFFGTKFNCYAVL